MFFKPKVSYKLLVSFSISLALTIGVDVTSLHWLGYWYNLAEECHKLGLSL